MIQEFVLVLVLGSLALACLKAAILEDDGYEEDTGDGYHGEDY